MDIYLNQYMNSNTIIINNISTYPNEWLVFLDKIKSFLKKYRYNETRNFNRYEKLKLETGRAYPNLKINKYENIHTEYLNQFYSLVCQTQFNLIGFHATRLTEEEIVNIKNCGLHLYNLTSLKKKIDDLFIFNYINKEDRDYLLNENLLNFEPDRCNKIYYTVGYVDISYKQYNKSFLFSFLDNYGGEIIYNATENSTLGEKLKQYSTPHVVLFQIESKDIDLFSIAKCIFDNYNTPLINKISFSDHLTHDVKKIIDVVEVNKKSKIKI